MQQQKDDFNRRHSAQFNSDFSTSNEAQMDDLSSTIQPLGKRRVSLPFRYLRTWLFSLLALVCLPIGIGVFLIGIEMEEDVREDWDEVTAEVIRNDANGVDYRITDGNSSDDEGSFGYDLDYFLDNTPGQLTLTASVCDLVSRFIIPKEQGSEFTLWVNPDKASQQSCVPINRDISSLYIVLGAVIMALSAIRLLRTINSAALAK